MAATAVAAFLWATAALTSGSGVLQAAQKSAPVLASSNNRPASLAKPESKKTNTKKSAKSGKMRLLIPSSSAASGPAKSQFLTGQKFLAEVSHLSLEQREARIQAAMIAGNVPISSKQFRDVNLTGKDLKGKPHVLTVRVMPDYAAVGTDQDTFRMPMQPRTAQAIADQLGYMLPTRKLVDAIHRSAIVALRPFSMGASSLMASAQYFWKHNEIIERQLQGKQKGLLIAGHKKDIVISAALKQQPHQLAIYGWHKMDGRPIQPLSLVHGERYVDYSHGIRFVSRVAILDGLIVDLNTIIRDRNLASLISDEGAILSPGYQSAWASTTSPGK